MRLVYLDEAGISQHETALCVAGVMVHGDLEVRAIEAAFDALVSKYIPPPDQIGFVFHACDLLHGGGYFDRRVWPEDVRHRILLDILQVIVALKLPIVQGGYKKALFGAGVLPEMEHEPKRVLMQTVATMDCAMWADRWLEKFAPAENALLIAEDTDRVKPLIKGAMKILRSPVLLDVPELAETRKAFGLPLKRIIDTVHFAAKSECRALQLADASAFLLGRFRKEKSIPQNMIAELGKQITWALEIPRPEGLNYIDN